MAEAGLTGRMLAAVDRAVNVLGEPPTAEEQAAGWTDDMLRWARDLAGQWQRMLPTGPASSVGDPNLVRAFDDAPGALGDPRRHDDRKEALLDAGIAIKHVQEVDRLRAQVLALCDELADPASRLVGDIAPASAAGIGGGLRALLDTIDKDGRLTQQAWDRWRDDLAAFGARWQVQEGISFLPGFSGPTRSWVDQPGALWQRLRVIDKELERLAFYGSFVAGELS